MSGWTRFEGTVDLKPGTTLSQIITLYSEHIEPDDDVPSLALLTDGDWSDCGGDLHFTVGGDQLIYDVNGDLGGMFVTNFEDFLDDVAKQYAARGWVGIEGEDEDNEVVYGADAQAILAAKEANIVSKIAWLEKDLEHVRSEQAKLSAIIA